MRDTPRDTETVTTLYRGDIVSVFDLDCHAFGPGDEALAMPAHAVFFVRDGAFEIETDAERVVGQSNHVLCFTRKLRYRVHHHVEGGDRCTVVGLSDDRLHELLVELDPASLDRAAAGFPHLRVPCAAAIALAQTRLFTDLTRNRVEPLEASERALRLVAAVMAPASLRAHPRLPRRGWRDLARAAEHLLTRRWQEPLTLGSLAAELGVSPFHLSRVFSRVIGVPLHRYVIELRLRAALHALAAGARDLTDLSLSLGFADAPHFTNTFRRAFGLSPSAFRRIGA